MLFVFRRPVLSTLSLVILLPFAVFHASQIVQDASVDGLIIQDEDKAYYDSVTETFGDDTLVVIMLKHPEGIFQQELLRSVKHISDSVDSLEITTHDEPFAVATHVASLATVNKILDKDGALDTDKLMDYLPGSEDEVLEVKADASRSQLILGNLLSHDLSATAINVYLRAPPEGAANYNRQVTAAIDTILEAERNRLGDLGIDVEIIQIGMPVIKSVLADSIQRDIILLVPISLLVILAILLFSFRSPIAVVIPFITGSLSVVGCLAFMSFMGYTINVVSNILPTLILVIGCTEDIHLLADYRNQYRKRGDKLTAIHNMMLKCGLAIFLTSMTTALGFATLKLNPIRMLQEFGISAAFGLLLNYVITIILVPTLLRCAPAPKMAGNERQSPLLDTLADKLFHLAVNHRPAVFIVTTAVVCVCVLGCLRVKVDADLVSFFKEDNQVRVKMRQLEQNLSGGQSFQVIVNTEGMGIEEGLKQPEIMQCVDELGEYLRTRFDFVISPADYIKVFHREFNEGDPEAYRIPDSSMEISQILMQLEGDEMDRILEPGCQNASIFVRHHVYGSWQMADETAKINEAVQRICPDGVNVKITGESILFNKAADTMAIGQVTSLALAVVIIVIIISILFVSPKAGLLAIVPNAIPILVNFGVMGWFNIPLNPGTCPVAVIALGIAIDDTIHLMVQFYKELKSTSDQEEAMRRTIKAQLLPVLSSSVALGVGFSVLIFADVVSSINFGYLTCLAMASALISDLMIAPGLLLSTRLISSWDLIKLQINEAAVAKSALFRDMKVSEVKKVILMGVLQEYSDGDIIIKQGSDCREMYLILEGRASVHFDGNVGQDGIKTLQKGDIFGELAFITGEKRSADVVARDRVEALRIDDGSLKNVRNRFPKVGAKLFYNISAILGERLQQTTEAWKTQSVYLDVE